MKSLLPVFVLLAALATAGCAGLDSVDDYFGRDAASNSINFSPGSPCDCPGAAIIMAPFAALQVLYDLSQGY